MISEILDKLPAQSHEEAAQIGSELISATEQIVGDDQANRLVNIPMRAPWRL